MIHTKLVATFPHFLDRKGEPIRWTSYNVDDYMKMLEYPQRKISPKKNLTPVSRLTPLDNRQPQSEVQSDNFMMRMTTYLESSDQEQRSSKAKFDVLAQANMQRQKGIFSDLVL